ncbi:uncharacterized protein LOC127838306 [Dreissena polymorpha]|nr:uncharacterized protein LOC127838306 [Dreissena polymorpha]XP_052221924.1 uncharacterized protein LOC127838306 [Dreissena polymorpha]
MNWLVVSLIVSACVIAAFGQEIPEANKLKCRLCNNALELRDCTKQAVCDNRTEECYMDEVITETFNVVYRGGCRGKEQCNGGQTSLVAPGKRDEVIACTRCCSNEDDCNKRLCGLRPDNTNTSQCYFCDSSKSDQASVSKPSDCITLTTCDTDQVCFAKNEYHPGSAMTFKYGCQNKYICRLLMKRVFEDLRHCASAGASDLECQHESQNCDVCCGDAACNYDDCKTIKGRLYKLWTLGKFNNDTLKVIP